MIFLFLMFNGMVIILPRPFRNPCCRRHHHHRRRPYRDDNIEYRTFPCRFGTTTMMVNDKIINFLWTWWPIVLSPLPPMIAQYNHSISNSNNNNNNRVLERYRDGWVTWQQKSSHNRTIIPIVRMAAAIVWLYPFRELRHYAPW